MRNFAMFNLLGAMYYQGVQYPRTIGSFMLAELDARLVNAIKPHEHTVHANNPLTYELPHDKIFAWKRQRVME